MRIRLAALAHLPALRHLLSSTVMAGLLDSTASAGVPRWCSQESPGLCKGFSLTATCCDDHPSAPECAKGFQPPPYVSCGNQTCVSGNDAGRCPTRGPSIIEGKTEADCRDQSVYTGGWREVCLDHTLTLACIPGLPTNYTGPPLVPPYQTCGGTRCTNHILLDDCFPKRSEALDLKLAPARDGNLCLSSLGLGRWQSVCLGGQVDLRCVPRNFAAKRDGARTFVTCPDASCAVGQDPKWVCP